MREARIDARDTPSARAGASGARPPDGRVVARPVRFVHNRGGRARAIAARGERSPTERFGTNVKIASVIAGRMFTRGANEAGTFAPPDLTRAGDGVVDAALAGARRARPSNVMASPPPHDATSAVTRALVLSNAAPGAVGQSVGLATALGFAPPRADSALVDAEDGGPPDAPGDVHCAIRLVGEAAFVASAPPPAPSSLGVSLVALAQRLVRSLPASWHVRLHALVEALAGGPSALGDVIFLGADLRGVARRALAARAEGLGRTLVLASGRGTVPACAALKRRCGSAVFAAQAQNPRCDPRRFDLVVLPRHDLAAAPPGSSSRGVMNNNVLVADGAMHALDRATLAAARERWRSTFRPKARPRVVVCVGAATRRFRLPTREHRAFAEDTRRLVDAARELRGGSTFVTCSRRTPETFRAAIEAAFERTGDGGGSRGDLERSANTTDTWVFDDAAASAAAADERPSLAGVRSADDAFVGAMAWADACVVTADSASMLSEAASLRFAADDDDSKDDEEDDSATVASASGSNRREGPPRAETGAPVPLFVAGAAAASGKARRLVDALVAAGRAVRLENAGGEKGGGGERERERERGEGRWDAAAAAAAAVRARAGDVRPGGGAARGTTA